MVVDILIKFEVDMGLINFDISKTLEDLETASTAHTRRSSMVSRDQELRKKPLKDFSIEELRSMIGKNSSLKYLVPLAIERLHVDSLAKGDTYEGDLLNAVLTVEKKFWVDDLHGYIPLLNAIIEKSSDLVKANPADYEKFMQHSSGAINIFKANIAHI